MSLALREGDEAGEEVVLDHGARGVVGVAHEDHLGALERLGRDGLEVRLEAELGDQREVHGGAVGQQRAGDVHRVPGVGGQGHVARVEQHLADVRDALLGAEQRDDLVGRVERDAEARRVEPGHGLAEAELALVARVLVRRRVGGALGERRDDVRRRGQVGIADAEADDVDAGGLALGDLALDGGEQVRRQRANAFCDPHGPPEVGLGGGGPTRGEPGTPARGRRGRSPRPARS